MNSWGLDEPSLASPGFGHGVVSARSHGAPSARSGNHSARGAQHVICPARGAQQVISPARGAPVHRGRELVEGHELPQMQRKVPIALSDPDAWPPDALTGFVANSEARRDLPPAAVVPTGHMGIPLMMQMPGMDNPTSPFVIPGSRGMAVRRPSQGYRQGRGSLASPPPASRGGGGLNVQANWPSLGRPFPFQGPESVGGAAYDVGKYVGDAYGGDGYGNFGSEDAAVGKQYLARSPENGPGKIPIGIRPSIQAQSAMLREMFPHAGALPVP